MGDSYNNSQKREGKFDNSRGGFKGGRGTGGRDQGGFRIRLSDNEMRSVRALQEAFNLRSTVAVLGFAVRTLGQMLEEGKLNNLIEEIRSQGDGRGTNNRGRDNRYQNEEKESMAKKDKPNPFARPEKPINQQDNKTDTEKDLDTKEVSNEISETDTEENENKDENPKIPGDE